MVVVTFSHEVTMFSRNGTHYIDCDANPATPADYMVERHREMGQVQWDPGKVELYQTSEQKHGKPIEITSVITLLAQEEDEKPMNANFLDFFLTHRECVPKNKKWHRPIFFLATTYRGSNGLVYVRYLCHDGMKHDHDQRCVQRLLYPTDWIALVKDA